MEMEQPVSTPRDYPRTSVRIPVLVEIMHAWERSTRRSTDAILSNVSRGGAGLSMAWTVPPRTRLAILVPAMGGDLRLLADVVWTSHTPGPDPESAAYGVRWVEYLSRHKLEAMLPAEGAPAP